MTSGIAVSLPRQYADGELIMVTLKNESRTKLKKKIPENPGDPHCLTTVTTGKGGHPDANK